jgi:ABC-2 type transport system permease protein
VMTHFVGTREMVRLILRRDRIRLPVWLVAIVGLVYASAAAVSQAYVTPEQIQAYASSVGGSPTAVAMAGPPFALDTVAGILVYETSLTALLGVALMAVFLTVRHTRTEEDEGRAELLRSTEVGRYAPTAATLAVLTGASLLVGGGVTLAVLSVGGIPTGGAVLYGASVAVFGIFFAAVAALVAQMMSHGRTAVGVSIAVLGLAYVLRAVGDINDGTLSWFSPMGWSQQVSAFEDDRWWPLLLSLVVATGVVLGAVMLMARRDLGAGIIPPRPGSPVASPLLSGPAGLALRLQRGSLVGWAAGIFVFGAVMGSFSQELLELVESNDLLQEFFATQGGSITDAYFAVMLLIIAVIVSAFTVGSALRLRGEETSGRGEPLLATPMSRQTWLAGSLAVTVLGTVLVLAAGGLGMALANAWVSDDLGQVLPLLGDTMVYLPAVLVLGALAVLLMGLAPRRALLAWVVVAYCFVIGYLGDLLEPPEWLTNLSPFSHTPEAPLEAVTATPLLVLSAVAVLMAAAGFVGFRRRDIPA